MYPFFQRLLRPFKQFRSTGSTSFKKPAYWLWRLLGNYTGGVSVTKGTVSGHSAVWASVGVNSRSISSVPFEVLQNTDKGVRKATEHYLYPLINSSPSPLYSSVDFREAMQGNYELDGNAYALKHYDGNGRIREFEMLNPPDVEPKLTENRELWYSVQRNPGGVKMYSSDDIIHIKGFGNGLKGLNPVAHLRSTFATPLGSQKYVNKFYENGAHLKSVLESDGEISPEQAKSLKEQIDNDYGGVDNSAKTMVLEYGLKYKTVGLKPSEMDFIKTLRNGVEDIARIWGVPLHLIGHSDGANTQQNFEQLNINYVTFTIYPRVKKWEQEFNRKIFTERERRQGYFVRFNLNGLMRGDTKTRGEFYLKMRQGLILTQNEIRDLEGWNADPNGNNLLTPLASNLKTEENGTQE